MLREPSPSRREGIGANRTLSLGEKGSVLGGPFPSGRGDRRESRCQAACKPGSVLDAPIARGIGWRPSIWDDGYPPPQATYPETARDEPLSPYLVLLRAGFTQPAGHPTAGALLPHHLTLTADRISWWTRRDRVGGVFLCTVRQVTLPGSYPAPCPAEPGLSSTRVRDVRRGRPAAWRDLL